MPLPSLFTELDKIFQFLHDEHGQIMPAYFELFKIFGSISSSDVRQLSQSVVPPEYGLCMEAPMVGIIMALCNIMAFGPLYTLIKLQ